MSATLEDEERAMGKWPRRLLYVPEMVSYAWQPGNTYNGIKEPEYNAITYTWGRWRLGEQERPDVERLDITIDGDSWPVPRVDPIHFTVDDFDLAILSATWKPREYDYDVEVDDYDAEIDDDDEFESRNSVDFLWLDIACIAQREDVHSAAEIGRQALIFQGAKRVFLWLTSISASELKKVVLNMQYIDSEQPAEYTTEHAQVNQGLVHLLNDPWFSSLWTLQEGFLRQDSILLSSDPTLVETDNEAICELHHILYYSSHWHSWFNRIRSGITDDVRAEFQLAERMIKERGLLALSSQHEISTYIAAQYRTASREDDRIYGLQQVFRFRLGKTALKPTSNVSTLPELENQFGETLLVEHPVHSQMHVYAAHVPARERWRIRSCSRELRDDAYRLPVLHDDRLPQMVGTPPDFRPQKPITDSEETKSFDFPEINGESLIWKTRPTALVIHCHFSIASPMSTPRPVAWRGLVCSFADLGSLWDRVYRQVHLRQRREAIADGIYEESEPLPDFPLFVDLDEVNGLLDMSKPDHTSRDAAAFLERRYRDGELKVLLLASCWPAYTRQGFNHAMFGLLIVAEVGQWARIGVCQWPCEAGWETRRMLLTTEEQLLVSGNGDRWTQSSGILGFVD